MREKDQEHRNTLKTYQALLTNGEIATAER